MRISILRSLLFAVPVASFLAQAPALRMNVIYECAAAESLKVLSCNGAAGSAVCDVQTYKGGQPILRVSMPQAQIASLLLPKCHLQTPAEAQAHPHSGALSASVNGASGAPGNAQVGAGGFKVGDAVLVQTAGGWMNAQVLQVRGNSYYVHAQIGAEVWKSYPAELRRAGKLTAEDHANGQYDLKDKVQVNVQGQWTEGEISGIFGNQFEVKLAGNRTVDTTVQNLRPSTAPPPAVRSASQPPRPGLVSCAGKFEGRYAPSSGLGGLSIVFRSGKATATLGLGGAEEYECWTGGGKIYLYTPGESSGGLAMHINNDGTLDTPFGEVKKKGN